jgi:single-stranded-DNA-specific exonuclease
MNFVWNYQPPTQELSEEAYALSKTTGLSPILCRLLILRGIRSKAEVQKFFNPQLNELLNPFLMEDMDKAVARINCAIERGERILVYGDYDVDGTTAVALVYNFLKRDYDNLDYYIPDRYNEGYGVSIQGIDYAYETGAKLIIVLDCGIKAIQEIAYAKEKGIDFIVCDHHVPDDELPPAVAILNAKRFDSTYPFKDLSGCGVGNLAYLVLFGLCDVVLVDCKVDLLIEIGNLLFDLNSFNNSLDNSLRRSLSSHGSSNGSSHRISSRPL